MKSWIKYFWLFYLIFFACYAVAPVSAILPDKKTSDFRGEQNVLKGQDRQTDIFMFDLALWKILKKTKCSDGPENVILEYEQKQKSSKNASLKLFTFTQDSLYAVTAHLSAASALYTGDTLLHYCSVYSNYPGLSPPPSA